MILGPSIRLQNAWVGGGWEAAELHCSIAFRKNSLQSIAGARSITILDLVDLVQALVYEEVLHAVVEGRRVDLIDFLDT